MSKLRFSKKHPGTARLHGRRINLDLYLYIFSVGLVLILAALWWIEFHYFITEQQTAVRKTQPQKTIVVFGDSLSTGYGIGWKSSYVAILQKKIRQPVIVAAQFGRTTAKALSVLDAEVISRRPNIVIVLLGGNDFLHGVPKSDLFHNLRQIVLTIKQTGAQVILVGIPAGRSEEYDAEFERLADETVSVYVPNILSGIIGVKELLWDQIHPNYEGHKIMAERIYKALAPLIEKL